MTGAHHAAMQAWRSLIRAKAGIRRVVHRELRERGLTGSQRYILRAALVAQMYAFIHEAEGDL